jgi:hypothetical protein
MIVKIQMPQNIQSNLLLIYNKDRTIMFQEEVTQAIIDIMKGQPKAFFHADLVDGNLVLRDSADWQDW